MEFSIFPTVLSFCVLLGSSFGAEKLETYNVDTSSITVSGLSSGGAMAMQFHVAFSREIQGAGIYAGLPYACGKGGLTSATLCMSSPATVVVPTLVQEIKSQAVSKAIDDTANLEGSKVFVFHGTKDTTVNPNTGKKVEELYGNFGVTSETEYSLAAVHGYPTDFYGAPCGSSSAGTHYINNCDYHGAYIGLNYLLGGGLIFPNSSATTLAGRFIEFNQGEFGGGLVSCMDASGYAYIPSGCESRERKCKLHLAFHGCQQSKTNLGDIYATKTGYLEVAEANDIIVLFPQATANMLIGNPNACWDWWGYLNKNYLNKEGAQMKAVHKMMTHVAGCDPVTGCDTTVTEPPPPPTTTVTTTTQSEGTTPPTNTTTTGNPGEGVCKDNEVGFHPFPGNCQLYILCACGAQVLQECAPGLVFDPIVKKCNFIQLVPGCDF